MVNLLVSKGICSIPECAEYNSARAEATGDFFECREYVLVLLFSSS